MVVTMALDGKSINIGLQNFNEDFIIMNRTTIQGPTGMVNAWSDGPKVSLAPMFDNSMETRQAMAAGVTSTGTIVAPIEMQNILKFDTYLKWVGRNTYVRLTDDGVKTPSMASVKQIQFSAEKVAVLPK